MVVAELDGLACRAACLPACRGLAAGLATAVDCADELAGVACAGWLEAWPWEACCALAWPLPPSCGRVAAWLPEVSSKLEPEAWPLVPEATCVSAARLVAAPLQGPAPAAAVIAPAAPATAMAAVHREGLRAACLAV